MSAGTVAILLLVLIAFDDRVRDQVSRRVVAHPSVELASAGRQLHDLTSCDRGGRARTEHRTRAAADLRAGGGGAHVLHAANLEWPLFSRSNRTGARPPISPPSCGSRSAPSSCIADTTEGALDAIGNRVPDLVLVPALLSPQDDAALAAALRVIAAAAHVRTLTIPVLASGTKKRAPAGGMLAKWRKNRAASPEPDGCDPAVFGEQISTYLQEAAAERAQIAEDELLNAERCTIADGGAPPT